MEVKKIEPEANVAAAQISRAFFTVAEFSRAYGPRTLNANRAGIF
jgi:hypothetical protein